MGLLDVQQDKTLTDYHAQINWGDSPAWDTNSSLTLDPTTGYVLIKGSHNYQASGTYEVTVYVTGPDGQTAGEAPPVDVYSSDAKGGVDSAIGRQHHAKVCGVKRRWFDDLQR